MRRYLGWALLIGALAVGTAASADPCTGPLPPSGATFSGRVAYIVDGDGLCVAVGPSPSEWVEVRLADFYAPELSGPGGEDAKVKLARVARGRQVECRAQKQSYDRVVAACTLNGVSLGTLMQQSGVNQGGRGWGRPQSWSGTSPKGDAASNPLGAAAVIALAMTIVGLTSYRRLRWLFRRSRYSRRPRMAAYRRKPQRAHARRSKSGSSGGRTRNVEKLPAQGGLSLAQHMQHPAASVHFRCAGCGHGYDVAAARVLERLMVRGLGNERTAVREVARAAERPCTRCGKMRWETRPGIGTQATHL